mmetsp:Transcript_10303/g.22895  ORF Transcript_10303/g.22895 Transcript_10303/m.22895 type:complete len:239 (+) Transcript_10303:1558-2274(+)
MTLPWRKMVLLCISFAVCCTDQRLFSKTLDLLQKAIELISNSSIMFRPSEAQEIGAYIDSGYAHYYFRRRKPSAASGYIKRAVRSLTLVGLWPQAATCHLHAAIIYSNLGHHDDALSNMGKVLKMVDDGRLGLLGKNVSTMCSSSLPLNFSEELLLVSVAYHNIAVAQLLLGHIQHACACSQNARRVARLCMSLSNQYLHTFDKTHKCILNEFLMRFQDSGHSLDQTFFRSLIAQMYD